MSAFKSGVAVNSHPAGSRKYKRLRIWREIKIGVLILVLCLTAALTTVAIYTQAHDTTSSTWLLLPVFSLIAAAILTSEALARRKTLEVTQSENSKLMWKRHGKRKTAIASKTQCPISDVTDEGASV